MEHTPRLQVPYWLPVIQQKSYNSQIIKSKPISTTASICVEAIVPVSN